MAIHVYRHVRGAVTAFQDRYDAGRQLAAFIDPEPDARSMVMALPRGGVPVARPLAEALEGELHPVAVRKLPIPSSPEMGFGAVAIDGTVVLNSRVVETFRIDDDTVRRVTAEVMSEINRRAMEYSGTLEVPRVSGRRVYLVDDGLATGYSVLAAGRMLSGMGPASMTLAVPVSPESSLRMINGMFEEKYCLMAQDRPSFAVASYYGDFHDMSDREVIEELRAAS